MRIWVALIGGFLLGIAFVITLLCIFMAIAAKLDYRNRDDLTKEEWRLK